MYILDSCRAKLHHNAALVQLPIGLEGEHKGVVDVINKQALYFTGEFGLAAFVGRCMYITPCMFDQYMNIQFSGGGKGPS